MSKQMETDLVRQMGSKHDFAPCVHQMKQPGVIPIDEHDPSTRDILKRIAEKLLRTAVAPGPAQPD